MQSKVCIILYFYLKWHHVPSQPVSAPTYRHLDQLVVFAAGVSPDEVDTHIAGDPVASSALSWPLSPVHQHLGRVAEFVQLVVVQPGASSNICGNMRRTKRKKKADESFSNTLYSFKNKQTHWVGSFLYHIHIDSNNTAVSMKRFLFPIFCGV